MLPNAVIKPGVGIENCHPTPFLSSFLGDRGEHSILEYTGLLHSTRPSLESQLCQLPSLGTFSKLLESSEPSFLGFLL